VISGTIASEPRALYCAGLLLTLVGLSSFHKADDSRTNQASQMQPPTRTLDTFTIGGIARRQSNDRTDMIGRQWQEFFAGGGVKQIPSRQSDDIYALYTDYEGDYTRPYTLVIGCRVKDGAALPTGFVAKPILAGKYAVFDAKGPQPASVVAAWQRIWGASLDRAYTTDFEQHRSAEEVDINVAVH
jgi:predicted transcriptional regulator YdeE